jgi:hypothetical protein
MANPILPIQSGANLPGLETEENIQEAMAQDAEMDYYEDALGLEPGDVEEEIVELEDGSVVVNYQEKQSPRKNPEFYGAKDYILPIDTAEKVMYAYSRAKIENDIG